MMKKLIAVLIAALLMLTAACADYRPVTASPTPSPYGTVYGTVKDAANGNAALAGVTAAVDGNTLQTGADGRYEFRLMGGASYTITFQKSGYTAATLTVTVRAGEESRKDCAMTPDGGVVKGFVADATDPALKLSGVTVSANGQSTTTNARGEYELRFPAGTYTLNYEKDGYVATEETVTISNGRETQQNKFMSKELAGNQYRVVLTWGRQSEGVERDLDSHLRGTSQRGSRYHVYYSTKKPAAAYDEAELDVDDTRWEGPETTTFTVTTSESYVFYIYRFSSEDRRGEYALSNSGAVVEVNFENQEPRRFTVPYGAGTYWVVFRIENGVFIPVNEIVRTEPLQ